MQHSAEALPAAPLAAARIDARVHSITHEAEGIVVLDIRPVDSAAETTLRAIEPGAHIDLHLANGLSRSYSLVNAPGDAGRFLVAVKYESSGRGGSRFIHAELRVGQRVTIGGPRNNFRLCEDAPHSVFIAGGIGITPLYGMIRRLDALGRSWELHYAAADREQAAFVDTMERLRPRTHFYFRSERPAHRALDIEETLRPRRGDAHFYCCGPARMLQAFEAAATSLSIPTERVHAEYFTARDEPALEGGFEVVLQRSGERLTVEPGETILDALIKRGVDVPYSCMEGVCGSCQVGVIEGTPDHRDLILSKEERDANDRMLICCSGSKTAKLVLDL